MRVLRQHNVVCDLKLRAFNRRTVMFVSIEVGRGIVYHGAWLPPLDVP